MQTICQLELVFGSVV